MLSPYQTFLVCLCLCACVCVVLLELDPQELRGPVPFRVPLKQLLWNRCLWLEHRKFQDLRRETGQTPTKHPDGCCNFAVDGFLVSLPKGTGQKKYPRFCRLRLKRSSPEKYKVQHLLCGLLFPGPWRDHSNHMRQEKGSIAGHGAWWI